MDGVYVVCKNKFCGKWLGAMGTLVDLSLDLAIFWANKFGIFLPIVARICDVRMLCRLMRSKVVRIAKCLITLATSNSLFQMYRVNVVCEMRLHCKFHGANLALELPYPEMGILQVHFKNLLALQHLLAQMTNYWHVLSALFPDFAALVVPSLPFNFFVTSFEIMCLELEEVIEGFITLTARKRHVSSP